MEKSILKRAHLDTLSMNDLIALADENGIDIPEGLNRRFIIRELLELAEDLDQEREDNEALLEGDFPADVAVLPETYNETKITVLLRDPAWVFVYWDIQSTLYSAITENHHFESFFLRVASIAPGPDHKVVDFFDVDVSPHDRKWYVHLSHTDMICRVDLYSRNTQGHVQPLAKSAELIVPSCGTVDTGFNVKRRNPPLVELSGIDELRKKHFRNHRQAFS
jgi:hypothetical protein